MGDAGIGSLDPDDLVTQYNAASVYALLGDAGRAMQLLESYMPYVTKDMIYLIRNDGDFDAVGPSALRSADRQARVSG
jgi:hypothetical protein